MEARNSTYNEWRLIIAHLAVMSATEKMYFDLARPCLLRQRPYLFWSTWVLPVTNSSRPLDITVLTLGQWSPWCDFRGVWASNSEEKKIFTYLLMSTIPTWGERRDKRVFFVAANTRLSHARHEGYALPSPIMADIIKFSSSLLSLEPAAQTVSVPFSRQPLSVTHVSIRDKIYVSPQSSK